MTLGSLFDGIGGWLIAAKHAGVRPIWSSEIEKFPCAVTAHHFTEVKQLGDITKIDGAEIEPVDIICAGSPCQDLSVAGKREGLDGARSGLFLRAIDIVRRMRRATNGKYPRFFVWENVPGAFSSNRGLDFRTVLEEISQTKIPMPKDNRWANAGVVEWGEGSLAWRVLDAQYWGVPQRRKRIFLVADFGGKSAGEILFERQGSNRHIAEGGETGEGTTSGAESGTGMPSGNCATIRMRAGKPGGGKGALVSYGRSLTLAANANDQVLFCLYDMAHADEVMRRIEGGKCQTLNARMGTGGNHAPVVFEPGACTRTGGHIYSDDKAPTLRANSGDNLPAIAFSIAGNTIDRKPQNGGNGAGWQKDVSYTLNTIDRHAVATFAESSFGMYEKSNVAGVQKAKGGALGGGSESLVCEGSVRRLTPLEAERLQGLPDVKRCVAFDLRNERLVMIEWLGYQNINVLSAVEKCLKKQKRVGSAESDKLRQSVSFAEKNLQPSDQSISKRVQKNARIFSEASDQETRSLLEKLRTVCNVDENLECHRRNQTTNFVPQNAPMNLTQENIIHNGEEGLQQKEEAIPQEDFGNTSLKEFGREIDVLAKGAEKYLMDMDGGSRFIMFDLTATAKKQDMMKKILSYFVQSVMRLHIQPKEQIVILLLEPKGYTLIDDKSCSDTARYKALGNGMAQPVADWVIQRIEKMALGVGK